MRNGAHRQAFALLEAVQGEDPSAALAAIEVAEGPAAAWPEVRFVLAAARCVHAIVRPDVHGPLGQVQTLLTLAADPAQTAIALGLEGLVAAGAGDTALLLSCTSRAVALLDDRTLPARERCLAYVINAAALNTLRLWELVDELYTRALEDPDAADAAGQGAAVAVNRVLIGLEHGLALLEYGDEPASQERLARVLTTVPAALAQPLRPLWRHDVEAIADLVRLLSGVPLSRPLEQHRAALLSETDVEVLPLLEAAAALVAFREHGLREPAELLGAAVSSSSGARTFPLWVRAKVLADTSPAVAAQQAHAREVSALLWASRAAVLSAARSQIETEHRRLEHERLALAVHTDPLTGLHNRRRFDDWLQRPEEGGTTALLLMDLDGFKAVNDRFGHACGDEVLRRVGLLLRAAVRPGDLAVRQGGDEFALVLRGLDLDGPAVLARAEEVAAAVRSEDWARVAPGLEVGLSIGVALLHVAAGQSPGPHLYGAADAALYRAKRERAGPVFARLLTLATDEAADG